MFSLAARLSELCSIRRVRFSSRAEALFRRTMVHDSGLKPSLSRSIFPIAHGKVFATRLRSRLNLGPRSFWCTAIYDIPGLQKAARKTAERKMRELVRSVNFGAVKYQTAFTDGSPVSDICAFAKDRDVDLIITSTHGFTGFTHVLIGSIAEQVVRHAPCSVLVVPSHPQVRAANLAKSDREMTNTLATRQRLQNSPKRYDANEKPSQARSAVSPQSNSFQLR